MSIGEDDEGSDTTTAVVALQAPSTLQHRQVYRYAEGTAHCARMLALHVRCLSRPPVSNECDGGRGG